MRIAVTYENGQIFQHFGHCGSFKLYEVSDGCVTGTQVLDAAGSGHGALAGFLKGYEVDVLICGGIGGGARMALDGAGIRLYPGATGDADAAVNDFLAGRLAYDPDTVCSHHQEGHEGSHDCGGHGEGHECGGHGDAHSCGGHGCGHQEGC